MGKYTEAAYRRLEQETDRLKAIYDDALIGLGAAAADGNNTWHDNPAFEEAKSKIEQARRRWEASRARLNAAVIVEQTESGRVEIGSNVLVRFVGDDRTETLHVSGEHVIREADDVVQQVSTSSPVGAALLGAKAGDSVSYRTPKGTTRNVQILEIW